MRNVPRSNVTTNGTTRALIERSRSANSRHGQISSAKEYGSSTTNKSPSVGNKYASNTTKKGVFTKANERKKRNIASKSGFQRTTGQKSLCSNGSSTDNPLEEFVDDTSSGDFIDINNVDDIMDDNELTETNIDDEMLLNASLEPRLNETNVEFIGCFPNRTHESHLNDEFNFSQTLPRSYKHQEDKKNSGSLIRFDMTKSVKSVLTVQEKLTQDYPSLPPQVIYVY